MGRESLFRRLRIGAWQLNLGPKSRVIGSESIPQLGYSYELIMSTCQLIEF